MSREVVAVATLVGGEVKAVVSPAIGTEDDARALAGVFAGGEVLTASGIFGSNSDGGIRMEEWLAVMCRGCRHERVKDRKAGIGGGSGCELVSRAVCDPYTAPMPEWTRDAEWPERFAGLDQPNPWPVCTAWEPRKKRSDAGKPRRPRGMEPMFEMPR